MRTTRLRRGLALVASAALLASLTAATVAAPTSAAEVDPAAKKTVKCDGKVATKVGTPGNDVIRGTAKRDIIAGLGGNDIILGGGGDDILCGGPGKDRLTGNAGKDKLIGGGGRDRLFGGDGPDRLFGGPQNDFLAGQTGPDVLGGGPGSDRLDGGIGVDLCSQGTGFGPMVRCELPQSVFAPDTDGDGILDSSDSCPAKGGIVGANGCPLDSDGDGVVDNVDACPNEGDAGFGLNGDGCPKSESQKICEDAEGDYSDGPVTVYNGVTAAPACEWDQTDEDTWSATLDSWRDLEVCGSSGLIGQRTVSPPPNRAYVGCRTD